MTDAWTDKNAQCSAKPSDTVVGRADAYWTSYACDAVGNRKTETAHKTASGPATDTLRTYAAPTPGKHDLPKVTQVGTGAHDEVTTPLVELFPGAANPYRFALHLRTAVVSANQPPMSRSTRASRAWRPMARWPGSGKDTGRARPMRSSVTFSTITSIRRGARVSRGAAGSGRPRARRWPPPLGCACPAS